MFRKLCTATIMAACMQLCASTVGAANANLLNFSLDRADLVTKERNESSNRGPRGKRGKCGCRGLQGLQGIQGPQGIQGIPGSQGPQGPQGDTGPQGPRGETGQTGPLGPRGPVGPTGPHGPQGPRGEHGHKGERGECGKKGEKGDNGAPGKDGKSAHPLNALCCDIFVDSCTQLSEHHQTGSIGAPYASIQRAIDKAKFADCTSCKNCRTINILIAAGCYGGDCDAVITIAGPTKINLIGLGPVSLGDFSSCACQPEGDDARVAINWSPTVCDVNSGVRPTLTITTLNTLADSITPYQSYSNKFRISGNINITSSACGDDSCSDSTATSTSSSTTENGVHYKHHSSDGVRIDSDGDMLRWHSSTNNASNSEFSKHQHSSDKTRHDSSSTRRKHSGSDILFTASGSTWANKSSVDVRVGKHHGTAKRSADKLYRDSSGSEKYRHTSDTKHFTRGDYPSGFHSGHAVAGKVKNGKVKHGKAHDAKIKKADGKGKKAKGAKVKGKNKKKVEKGFMDFLGLGAKAKATQAQALQIQLDPSLCFANQCDLCLASQIIFQNATCLPAELHLNAEVFGDLNVSGVAMMYLYKTRIHGFVNAQNSDLVVAERTRFDNALNIHYYGFVSFSELLGDVNVSGTSLWDYANGPEGFGPQCNSLFLTGFFNTFFCGNFNGPDGATFEYDPVTGCSFANNNGCIIGGATPNPLVTYTFTGTGPDPVPTGVVQSCIPGSTCPDV